MGELDEEQAGGVVGPVVRLEGQDAELRDLTVPDLMQDFARLHVPLRIVSRRLERCEAGQRPSRQLGRPHDRLHRGHQRVPPKQREEPRSARGGHQVVWVVRIDQVERLHVHHRAIPRELNGAILGSQGDVAAQGCLAIRGLLEGAAVQRRPHHARLGHR